MFRYIIKPAVSMRREPSVFSEVVSEALFSEEIAVLDSIDGWLKIATSVDHYEGWIADGSVCERSTPFLSDGKEIVVDRCAAHLYREPDTIYGPILTLPFESRLQLCRELDDGRWIEVAFPNGLRGFIQRGDVAFDWRPIDLQSLIILSHKFLGLPYTWGGRSSFGYDCSGYVQMLFRRMGIYLPRDAEDQYVWEGLSGLVPLNQLEPGDLLFFGFSEDKIKHVGFHLKEGSFIHTAASTENAPYVRVSHVRDKAWSGAGFYPYVSAKRVNDLDHLCFCE